MACCYEEHSPKDICPGPDDATRRLLDAMDARLTGAMKALRAAEYCIRLHCGGCDCDNAYLVRSMVLAPSSSACPGGDCQCHARPGGVDSEK